MSRTVETRMYRKSDLLKVRLYATAVRGFNFIAPRSLAMHMMGIYSCFLRDCADMMTKLDYLALLDQSRQRPHTTPVSRRHPVDLIHDQTRFVGDRDSSCIGRLQT